MALIKISATEARNRFFEMIEMVAYKDLAVVIKRNDKDLVRIVPEKKVASSFIPLEEVIRETYGMCADSYKENWPYERKKVIKKEKKANIDWSE